MNPEIQKANDMLSLHEGLRIDSNQFVAVKGSFGTTNVVSKTANFTVGLTENYIIVNNAATTTVTLPSAASFPGRIIVLKTLQAQTVVSNASNVVALTGGAAGTAILAATGGKWAQLVSDSTNWIIMTAN